MLLNLRECVAANAPPAPPAARAADITAPGGLCDGVSEIAHSPMRLRLAGASTDSLGGSGLDSGTRGGSATSLRSLGLGLRSGLIVGSMAGSSRAVGDSADSLAGLDHWGTGEGLVLGSELPEREFEFRDSDFDDAEEVDDLGGFFAPASERTGKWLAWDQGEMRVRFLDWAAPQPAPLVAGSDPVPASGSPPLSPGALATQPDMPPPAADSGPDPVPAPNPVLFSEAPAAEPGLPPPVAPHERFDTVIASDVVYEVLVATDQGLGSMSAMLMLLCSCGYAASARLSGIARAQAPQAKLVAAVVAQRLDPGGRALIAVAVRDRVRTLNLTLHTALQEQRRGLPGGSIILCPALVVMAVLEVVGPDRSKPCVVSGRTRRLPSAHRFGRERQGADPSSGHARGCIRQKTCCSPCHNSSLTAGVMLAHAKAGNRNCKQSYLAGVGVSGC